MWLYIDALVGVATMAPPRTFSEETRRVINCSWIFKHGLSQKHLKTVLVFRGKVREGEGEIEREKQEIEKLKLQLQEREVKNKRQRLEEMHGKTSILSISKLSLSDQRKGQGGR